MGFFEDYFASFTPERATELLLKAAFTSETDIPKRPHHLFEFIGSCFDGVFWYRQHQESSNANDFSPESLRFVVDRGLEAANDLLHTTEPKRQEHYQASSILACKPLVELITSVRPISFELFGIAATEASHNLLEAVRRQYLDFVARKIYRSTDTNHESSEEKSATQKPMGYIFETVALGAVNESKILREARIFGLPASSALEKGSSQNTAPVDIILYHLKDDGTLEVVAGIQCRTRRQKARPKDPFVITFNLIDRSHHAKKGKNISELIESRIVDWLSGEDESINRRLIHALQISKNPIVPALIKDAKERLAASQE